MGGPVISPDDTEARRASSELEGQRLDSASASALALPERLSPLTRAAWGSLVGGASLLVGAGVLSSFAEREEDRAARLARLVNPETGKQPLFADEQAAYRDHVERGQALARTAQIFAITGAVGVATSVALFIAERRRHGEERVSLHSAGPGTVEIRF